MNQRQIFINTASWEPRCIEGVRRVFSTHQFASAIFFWFEEYPERTEKVRKELMKIADGLSPIFVPLPMYAPDKLTNRYTTPSYITAWKEIRRALYESCPAFDSFVLDITTMPREALWIILDLLTEKGISGKVVYHRAESHGDWCASDPERPHIVPKLGGLPSHERASKLLVVSGYDVDRSEQFIASYEPRETLILFQEFPKGVNPENENKSERRSKLRFGNRGNAIKLKGVNCYEPDWGFSRILSEARLLGENANLILASVGPKTSAVSLYRVHRHLYESSLVYAACKNYNKDYSIGIGETMSIDWNPKELISES
jgi:hypothetical protein